MIFKTRLLTAALIAFGLTSVSYAAEEGFYIGAAAGATDQHNNSRTLLTNSDPAMVTVNPSNRGIGERFFMGYAINKYASFEGGFTHYGAASYKVPQTVACNNPTVNENGIDMEGKGTVPLANFGIFGKAGFSVIRQTLSGSLVAGSNSISPCGTGGGSGATTSVRPLVGLGVSYDINENWSTDLFWTRVLSGGGIHAADFVGLGIAYHAVATHCGQFLC